MGVSKSFLRNRHLAGAYIVRATMHAGFMSVLTYLPFRLSQAPYRLSNSQISFIYILYLLGALVAPRAGRLSDRLDVVTFLASNLDEIIP